jgi:hypothetical protein
MKTSCFGFFRFSSGRSGGCGVHFHGFFGKDRYWDIYLGKKKETNSLQER